MANIEIIRGDITKVSVDVIVNAANSSLLGGGGVDGTIHAVGGPDILRGCRNIREKQGGCPAGEAVITGAGKLNAKYVIHTVGPIWTGGNSLESEKLKSCYQKSLQYAEKYKAASIAFPNISTGVYHFPKEPAAEIVVDTVTHFKFKNLQRVIFVCYDEENYLLYLKILNLFRKKYNPTNMVLSVIL